MKIAYDAKRAMYNFTGLGNYSRLVMECVAAQFPDIDLLAFTPGITDNPRLSGLKSMPNVKWILPAGAMRNFKSLWRSTVMINQAIKEGASVFHGLSNEIPLTSGSIGMPTVVTIHDLIFRRLPYCYAPIDRKLYDFKYGRSCKTATRIIAISEATKRDIIDLYGINEDKIDVIYQGCDGSFRQIPDATRLEEVKHKYGLRTPYIIQVGTVEKRKNLELSIRAMAALPKHLQPNLAVVGKGGAYLKQMKDLSKELGVAQLIKWLPGVPFADLPALYRMAEFSLYPSHYEGFGIPILEALECGTPVIAANTSSLPEAGGNATVYVEPDDVGAMKEAMESILTHSAPVDEMIAKGYEHARKFDTANMADSLMLTYQKALGANL